MSKEPIVDKKVFIVKPSYRQRIWALVIFLAIFFIFIFFHLAFKGKIDLSVLFDPCGFKQKYDLPCPCCGFTSSIVAFSGGKVFESVYLQPAAGLFCFVLILIGILSFLASFCGIHFSIIDKFFSEVKLRYIFLALLLIILSAWLVLLSRALAVRP
jgi:hypothetical protein